MDPDRTPLTTSRALADERIATMTSNPHAENVLARELALSWHAGGSPVAAARARAVAERVWERSAATPHDRRTLFAASRLRAAVALHRLPRPIVEVAEIRALTKDMLARQYRRTGGEVLAGYFLECPGGREPFRSIPYSCEPALALLDASTVLPEPDSIRARAAVADYIDSYLLADARSNPFGLPPYGVYHLHDSDPRQAFREVSTGYGARTFMAPWNPQSIVHGTGAVVMHQCYLLARAAAELGRSDWADASDRILQWATGANPQCMSLFLSLGYRHPVPFSPRYPNLPGAVINGHIGRLDDSPYLEESNAVNWNTQEVYGVPTTYAAQAALWASGANRRAAAAINGRRRAVALGMNVTELGGAWTVERSGGPATELIAEQELAGVVPGTIHTDLLRAGLIDDPFDADNESALSWIGKSVWEYSKTFTFDPRSADRHDLVCEGLDTIATITINGAVVAHTQNQHRTYRFDLRPYLATGENRIAVRFDSAEAHALSMEGRYGARPHSYTDPYNCIRKAASNFGWDWGIRAVTAGIWRRIYIHH